MSTKSPHVKHEAELFHAIDSRTRETIESKGSPSPGDEYVAMAIGSQLVPVRHQERSAFKLPFATRKFVGDEATAVLQDLLYETWEINEQFVGEPQLDAFVQLNGCPEQIDIIERSLEWARGYVARRVARVSTRDRGCPYRKFHRLYNELLPFIDQIGLVEEEDGAVTSADAIGQLLGPMCDYVAWSFFEATWAGDARWHDDGSAELPAVPGVDPEIQMQCRRVFSVYNWKQVRIFDQMMDRFGRALAAKGIEVAPEADELARIHLMAQDMLEMKPFLVRNFRPEKAVAPLVDGIVGGFMWANLNRLGILRCGPTERALLEEHRRSLSMLPLGIRYDGLLTCNVNSWRTAANHEPNLPAPPLTINRVVLEAVHAKLFGFYDQIDVDAILDRWRSTEEAIESTEEEDEAIAASIAVDARREVEAGMAPAGRVSSSLRLNRLLSILEGEFGCTSRSGKGSELVVYREGALQAVVGRHKANPQVSAMSIRRILRKLGIAVREWLDTTCR